MITATTSGNQPPWSTFGRLAPKNARSMTRKKRRRRRPATAACATARDDEEEQQRVDRQRAGDRDPVGRGQVVGGAEAEHERGDRGEDGPVDDRHVDLADLAPVCDAPQPRQEAELHGLARDRERAGDDACEAMTAARWRAPPSASAPSSGTAGRTGCRPPRGPEDQRALADVVEHQRREDDEEPRAADRGRPKWPMSAYSASAPVTASTTAPSARNAAEPWSKRNGAL